MFNQEAKVEQMQSQTKSATEILTNFRHFNERGQASFPAEFPKELELAVITAVLQTPAPRPTNVMENTIDSMGSSCVKSLTGTVVRLREQALDRSITVVNQQKANPEKKFFIERMAICGEWTLLKVYNINPDGTHVYNETITRLLQNTNDLYLVRSVLSLAIMV